MPWGSQGPVSPYNVYSSIPQTFFGIMINWFAPRCPLLARLPKIPEGNNIFNMVGHAYRPRTVGIGSTGFVNNTDVTTTITIADASSLMGGDVFYTTGGEYVEVVSDPTAGSNSVTFQRGVASSSKATAAGSSLLTLVGNTRTGAEDTPQAIASALTNVTQYMQTIQHPYTIGGSTQTNTMFPVQPGAATPLDQYRMDATQNWMDDAEQSAYWGKSEAVSSATTHRQKMAGVFNLITTNSIVSGDSQFGTSAGTYATASFTAAAFQNFLVTRPRKKGGQPDVVVVSSNWFNAFAIWGIPLNRIMEGNTVFGRPINTYASPFLGDIELWESSLMPDFTAFSLTQMEARWRVKRPLVDEPLAKTGDVMKGQMIGELAIELDNEAHHACIQPSTVTGFAYSNPNSGGL